MIAGRTRPGVQWARLLAETYNDNPLSINGMGRPGRGRGRSDPVYSSRLLPFLLYPDPFGTWDAFWSLLQPTMDGRTGRAGRLSVLRGLFSLSSCLKSMNGLGFTSLVVR